MKKQIASLAILLFCAAGVQAEEQISSISFNPSRLGLFEQLRLTEGMTSRGNVTVSDVFLIRKNTTLTTKDGLTVNKDIDAQRGRVDIPATDLQINSGGSPSLKVTGGYALFLNDSRIGSLPTNTWIRSPEINLGTLTVTGGPGILFNAEDSANGLVLGGNDIPLTPSDCTGGLAWVSRKDSSGSTYQVLSVQGCPESTTECPNKGTFYIGQRCYGQDHFSIVTGSLAGQEYYFYSEGTIGTSGGSESCMFDDKTCSYRSLACNITNQHWVRIQGPSWEDKDKVPCGSLGEDIRIAAYCTYEQAQNGTTAKIEYGDCINGKRPYTIWQCQTLNPWRLDHFCVADGVCSDEISYSGPTYCN